VPELRAGKKATSGGSRETDVNEPTIIPMGDPSAWVDVTKETPVGYWPRTCRYHFGSIGPASPAIGISYRRFNTSPRIFKAWRW
jgi:hypothetical protein